MHKNMKLTEAEAAKINAAFLDVKFAATPHARAVAMDRFRAINKGILASLVDENTNG